MPDVIRAGDVNPMHSAGPDSVRYAIVTPVMNEEEFLPEMIESVVNQTVRPQEWIIVDDGSTDGTVEIIRRAVSAHEWIRCVRIDHTGGRQPGGEGALPTGLRLLDLTTCEFFARLDADISFERDYFEKLFNEFRNNPRLGIATGVCWVRQGGALVEEKNPRFHTRGPLKTYRVACFQQIGSLERVLGWDIVDDARANMLGWQTRNFPHLRVIHRRPTQTAGGRLKGYRNVGLAAYFTGYHPLFLLARAVYTMRRPPYVLGGIFVGLGFLHGYIARKPQVNDRALIRYVRQQQLNRLTGRETIWK